MPRRRALRVADELQSLVRRLHPEAKRKVRGALEQMLREPSVGQALVGELKGLVRVRLGDLGIVYRVTRSTIEVVAIGPRASVYLDLAARLRSGRG